MQSCVLLKERDPDSDRNSATSCKMLVERALETEMSEHLGHGKSAAVTNATGNTRNGHNAKTLQGEFGELPLDIPRDRQGAFEPKLVARHQTRWTGFDDRRKQLTRLRRRF